MVIKVNSKLNKAGELTTEVVFDSETAECVRIYAVIEKEFKQEDPFGIIEALHRAAENGEYKAKVKCGIKDMIKLKESLRNILQEANDFKTLVNGIDYVIRSG